MIDERCHGCKLYNREECFGAKEICEYFAEGPSRKNISSTSTRELVPDTMMLKENRKRQYQLNRVIYKTERNEVVIDDEIVRPKFTSSFITVGQAYQYVHRYVNVAGIVTEVTFRDDVVGCPTFITIKESGVKLGLLTAIIWERDKMKFGNSLSEEYLKKVVCLFGKIRIYNKQLQMDLMSPRQIEVLW